MLIESTNVGQMYSDEWVKNYNTRLSKIVKLKKNLIFYRYYSSSRSNDILGISIDFKYAQNSHVELMYSNALRLKELLYNLTNEEKLENSLRAFFENKNSAKREELKSLIEMLDKNKIAYKVITIDK